MDIDNQFKIILMTRQEAYEIIDSELDYQKANADTDTHIVSDFPLSSGLTAIDVKLETAKRQWYYSKAPYPDAMEEIRKIAAICVQMIEKYGCNKRK